MLFGFGHYSLCLTQFPLLGRFPLKMFVCLAAPYLSGFSSLTRDRTWATATGVRSPSFGPPGKFPKIYVNTKRH